MELTTEIFHKLEILSDAAKYDVACTSSGSSRKGVKGTMGNAVSAGLCHCFAADGRCISLLKILQTNECVYDCKYCQNRLSNDIPRAHFTPEEIAELTISFYRRNYIEGLFLSSGIRKNPDFTMEQIYQAIYLLRNRYKFNGYIHVKAIPGADPLLIEKTGWLADRMSVNLEMPTSAGLKTLAPQKSRKTILTPMRQIQVGRKENRLLLEGRRLPGVQNQMRIGAAPEDETFSDTALPAGHAGATAAGTQTASMPADGTRTAGTPPDVTPSGGMYSKKQLPETPKQNFSLQEFHPNASFVPAGQSTQMIVGASDESDYEIVHMAAAMYKQFDLKRVFYSAFVNTTHDPILPEIKEGPPLLREHRLYQADFLLRFYQFEAEEIITEDTPFLNVQIDPKCNWALNHLAFFPVEVQTADYHTLLRIPGVGVKSARRILAARRLGHLDFASLKKFGVVLKRAMYFITCGGKTMIPLKLNEKFILTNLLGLRERLPASVTGENMYEQMSLLDFLP